MSRALKRYADQHAAISVNRLRRIAGLPASRLIDYRDYVIEVAHARALPFDARCAVSPWREMPHTETANASSQGNPSQCRSV